MPFVQSCPAADAVGHHRDHHLSDFHNHLRLFPRPITNPYGDFSDRKLYQDYESYAFGYGAAPPPLKRRRSGDSTWDATNRNQQQPWDWHGVGGNFPSSSNTSFQLPRRSGADDAADDGYHNSRRYQEAAHMQRQFDPPPLRQTVKSEDDVLVSRDKIERCSPSRKDGIDSVLETQLRYSYCLYLQNLGMRLQLPQTSIATATILCHRFFFRRSHACHDRFLIATAALFLATKSEETPCLLNSVLRASCEISEELELAYYPYLLPGDWFQEYRELIIEAEQMILITLDFELDVEHPYAPLASVLNKLGLSETVLVSVAWNLISEGLRSSLWLQFKPQHIAAGAAFLAAKFLNYDLAYYPSFWHAFQTTPPILQDVVLQLMELF